MKTLFLSLLFLPAFTQAQRWHVNVTGGLSNYSGDLQGNTYTFNQSFFAFGAGLQYDITRNFSAISNISFMKVGASDQFNNPDLVFRNLSFQTNIIEWNLVVNILSWILQEVHFHPLFLEGLQYFILIRTLMILPVTKFT
jgi:hypothetical protein